MSAETKPSESPPKFQPYVPASSTMREFTFRAAVLGLIMTGILGAATAYLAEVLLMGFGLFALSRIAARPRRPAATSLRTGLWEGVAFVFSQRLLLSAREARQGGEPVRGGVHGEARAREERGEEERLRRAVLDDQNLVVHDASPADWLS